MSTHPVPPASTDVDLDVAGLVGARVRHADRLAPPLARRFAQALLPLAVPVVGPDPEILVEVVDTVPVPDRRAEYGVRIVGDGRVWLGDHRLRGASVRVTDRGAHVQLQRDADASVLNALHLPVWQIALRAVGGGTLRAAGVEVRGRRLAIAGWSGSGKTQVVLELLARHGGRLLGDDLLAVTADGEVAPMWCMLTTRAEHGPLLPPAARRHARWRRAGARLLDRCSQLEPLGRTLAAFTAAGARVLRDYSELDVGVGEVEGAAGLGTRGPLDAVLLLGGRAPADVPLAHQVAAHGGSYSGHLAAFEAALLAQGMPAPVLPSFADRLTTAQRALAGVAVVHGAAGPRRRVSELAEQLLAAAAPGERLAP